MLFLTLFFAFFSSADIKDIIKAQSLQQLVKTAEINAKERQLYDQCQIELVDGFVPSHCYIWVHVQKISSVKKQRLMDWFDQACVQAVQRQDQAFEGAFEHQRILGEPCRHALKVWADEWLYKMSRENKKLFLSQLTRPSLEKQSQGNRILRYQR